ncbi:MAG: hypothetical protein AMXMBFR23_02770 [Chloroflexota bacterium]|jgi:hypothetical protein
MVVKRTWYGVEEIIGKLREAEVGLTQGQSVGQVAPLRTTNLHLHAIYSRVFEVSS